MVGELLRDIVYGLRGIDAVKNENCQVAIVSGGGKIRVSSMDMPCIFVHVKDEDNDSVHQYLGGRRHYAYRIDFYVCTNFVDPHMAIHSENDEQIKWLNYADVLQKEIEILFSSKKFIHLRRKYSFVAHYRKTSFKQLTAFDDSLDGQQGFVHSHVIEYGIDGIGSDPFVAGGLSAEAIDIEVFMNKQKVAEIAWQKSEN